LNGGFVVCSVSSIWTHLKCFFAGAGDQVIDSLNVLNKESSEGWFQQLLVTMFRIAFV
jgi:hypothetical protein